MKNNKNTNAYGLTKAQVSQLVRQEINSQVEAKVTYIRNSVGVDYNGTIFDLSNNLTRGDAAQDQFTGNLIRPRSVKVNYTLSTNQTYTTMRLILFRWMDASVPAAAGILQFPGSTLAPHSPLNWTNVHKIKVLYDKTSVMFPVAGSYAACNHEFKLGPQPTIQFDTAGTNQQMNGLYMLVISDDIIPAYPFVHFWAETRFTDA